jgi:hypothetical protein
MMVAFSGSEVKGSRSVATWRVPRTRGAASGVLLVLLGVWGALVPFVGPRFGYAYTPDAAWLMTSGRLWLDVVPGAVVALCGLILIASTSRALGLWAGWLAAVAGAWFVLGPALSRLWGGGQPQTGAPVATDTLHSIVTEIGFYSGLGVVIVFLAAAALGRFSVVGLREATRAAGPVTTEHAVAEQRTTTMPVADPAATTYQAPGRDPVWPAGERGVVPPEEKRPDGI